MTEQLISILHAWIAATNELPIAGHVIVRQRPGRRRIAEVGRLFAAPAARRQGMVRQ